MAPTRNPLAQAAEELRQAPPPLPMSPESGAESEDERDDLDPQARVEPAQPTAPGGNKPVIKFGGIEDILSGTVRGGVGAVNETVDLAAQAGKAGGDALWSLEPVRTALDPRKDTFWGSFARGAIKVNDFVRGIGFMGKDGDVADIPMPEQSDAALGRISEGLSQTIVGFVAGGRVLKGLGVGPATTTGGRILKGAAQGALGDFMAFDGNEERLSNLVEMVPALRNPVTAFLAADDETPELAGRVKNTLEGLGVGGAFEAILGVLRGTKALRKGDKAGVAAAADETEAAINTRKAQRAAGVAAGDTVGRQHSTPKQATKQPISEPPPEVLSRADADVLVKEIEFNRNFSRAEGGDLRIKPDTEPKLTETHGEWTLGTYGDPANLDATLRALVEKTTPKTARTDADLMEATKAAADELGQSPEMVLATGAHIAGIAGDIDTAVQTMRTLWARTARNVDAHVGKDLRALSEEEFAVVRKDIHNAMTFSNYQGQVKSAMGRGLRVFQLPDSDTYAKLVAEADPKGVLKRGDRDMPPLPVSREEANDWLELWGFTKGDAAARNKFLEGLNTVPGKWRHLRTSFANLMTANMLSGVPSVMLNVAGPALVGALRTIEKTGGGYVAALTTLNPAKRAELLASASNAATAYASTMGDVAQAFRFALQAASEGRSILGGGASLQDLPTQFGPLTENLLKAANQKPSWQYTLGNVLNLWPKQFARLNNGLDEFSKRLAYLGEVRVRALTDGSQQGLRGDQLKQFVTQKLATSTDEVGMAADEDMLRAAERTTLTGSVGGEGTWARKAAGLVNDLRANAPETRAILPIFNVAANSVGETLRRTPVLNFVFKENWEELLGRRGAVAQAEAYGRTMLGAGFLMSGLYMARSGMITGPGPDNPSDRKVWMQTHQPWSVRWGDQWVDYSRYDIVGALLGIPATLFDASVNRRQDRGFDTLSYAAVGALVGYFRDRAALQTASDLMSLGEPGTNPESFFERLQGSVAGKVLVPNFVTQLGRNVTDPTNRVKTNVLEYVMDLIPGWSKELDPLRNVLGEPVHKPKDQLVENLLPVTYVSAVDWRDDAVIDELDRLYQATGYGAGVTPRTSVDGGFFNSQALKLEDGRSLFDAFMRQRATLEVKGLTLRDTLTELFDSAEYAEAVDADASNLETSDGLKSRGALVGKVFEEFNKAAKKAIANESPLAARYLAVVKAKRTDDAKLRAYGAGDLASDGGKLLDALGIDIEQYEDAARGQ